MYWVIGVKMVEDIDITDVRITDTPINRSIYGKKYLLGIWLNLLTQIGIIGFIVVYIPILELYI